MRQRRERSEEGEPDVDVRPPGKNPVLHQLTRRPWITGGETEEIERA
jgi:hypothetical protein